MVFQRRDPTFGLLLTDWDSTASRSSPASSAWPVGVLAYFALHRRGRFRRPAIAVWSGLFAAFLVYVSVS